MFIHAEQSAEALPLAGSECGNAQPTVRASVYAQGICRRETIHAQAPTAPTTAVAANAARLRETEIGLEDAGVEPHRAAGVAHLPRKHLAERADEGGEAADDLGSAAGRNQRRPFGGGRRLRIMPAKAQHTPCVPWNAAYGPLRPNHVMVATTTSGAAAANVPVSKRPSSSTTAASAANACKPVGSASHPALRSPCWCSGRRAGAVFRRCSGCNEGRLAPCGKAAVRRLDVDDLRTVVCEQLAAIAAGNRAGHIEHLQLGQGRCVVTGAVIG